MYMSPKIHLYDSKEHPLMSPFQLDCDIKTLDYIKESSYEYIQIGVGYGWGLLASEKHKIADLSDERIYELLEHVNKLDLYEGSDYIFGWMKEPRWKIDDSLYAAK